MKPRGFDLPREPFPELSAPGVERMDDLDRDLTAAGGYPEEHLPHPAGTQPAEQPVAAHADRIARLKRIHRPTPQGSIRGGA